MSTNHPLGSNNSEKLYIPNRRQSRKKREREFSNKKGIQLVVIGIFKYKKVFQRIGNKTIVHTILAHPIN